MFSGYVHKILLGSNLTKWNFEQQKLLVEFSMVYPTPFESHAALSVTESEHALYRLLTPYQDLLLYNQIETHLSPFYEC